MLGDRDARHRGGGAAALKTVARDSLQIPSRRRVVVPHGTGRTDGAAAYGLAADRPRRPHVDLCVDGEPHGSARRAAPTRGTPISFLLREEMPLIVPPRAPDPDVSRLSGAARDVVRFLSARGASFLTDIARGCGLLPAEVEDALWECVSAGLVTGDGVAGLRMLLSAASRIRRRTHRLRALPGRSPAEGWRHVPVGRWVLWRPPDDRVAPEQRHEAMARQLLLRYGVIFRELCVRERRAPSWRVLVNVYRRWEARQQIRGGRFVSGFVGEQFALPEALEALRAVRRAPAEREVVIVSAADPTSLVGVVLPGERVPARSGLVVAYSNGTVQDVGTLGAVRSRLRASGGSPVAAG